MGYPQQLRFPQRSNKIDRSNTSSLGQGEK